MIARVKLKAGDQLAEPRQDDRMWVYREACAKGVAIQNEIPDVAYQGVRKEEDAIVMNAQNQILASEERLKKEIGEKKNGLS